MRTREKERRRLLTGKMPVFVRASSRALTTLYGMLD